MAKIYYDLIIAGYRAIEDVPLRWRDEVQNMLNEDNE